MKIKCTKYEFAELVRNCIPEEGCSRCVFRTACSAGDEPHSDDIMERIEDICEIGDGEDGCEYRE